MSDLLRTVFHVHTDHSRDGETPVAELLDEAREHRVDCMAITDHDTLDGALHAAALAGDCPRIIIGEEISTADGHLIGLFLERTVAPGMPLRHTAEQIRAQGGLVIVPHPFNRLFDCGVNERIADIIDLIDAVEVCNAQNLLSRPNRRAAAFAQRHGLTPIVGSDAHLRGSLAACWQWMEPFEDAAGFLESLRAATLVPGRHATGYFLRAVGLILRYRLGLGFPAGFGSNAIGVRRASRSELTMPAACVFPVRPDDGARSRGRTTSNRCRANSP